MKTEREGAEPVAKIDFVFHVHKTCFRLPHSEQEDKHRQSERGVVVDRRGKKIVQEKKVFLLFTELARKVVDGCL